jgi:hypothetical protein
MTLSMLLLPALLALQAVPAAAQCCAPKAAPAPHRDQARTGSTPSEGAPAAKAVNTVCPVMGSPVKAGRDTEVTVREKVYLVCCGGCGPEMVEHPAKYLDEAGRPLNDPARTPGSPAPAHPDTHAEHHR